MFLLKRLLKKDMVRIFLLSAVLAAAGLAVRHMPGALRNLSDWCFMVGQVHFFVGATRYIRNVGLFKTFSYMAYKRRWKKHGRASGEVRPMSLAEYTVNVVLDEQRQKPVGWCLLAGLLWTAGSLLAAVLSR